MIHGNHHTRHRSNNSHTPYTPYTIHHIPHTGVHLTRATVPIIGMILIEEGGGFLTPGGLGVLIACGFFPAIFFPIYIGYIVGTTIYQRLINPSLSLTSNTHTFSQTQPFKQLELQHCSCCVASWGSFCLSQRL